VQSRQTNIDKGNRETSPGKVPKVRTLENLKPIKSKEGKTKKNLG